MLSLLNNNTGFYSTAPGSFMWLEVWRLKDRCYLLSLKNHITELAQEDTLCIIGLDQHCIYLFH